MILTFITVLLCAHRTPCASGAPLCSMGL